MAAQQVSEVPNSKRRKVTGKACAVAECSGRHSDGISLHQFPKNPRQRQQWIDFVRTCRADFGSKFGTPNNNSFICERHFTSDAYPLNIRLSAELGFPKKCKVLNPEAVPTIQKHLHSSSRRLPVYQNSMPSTSGLSTTTTVTTACGSATTTATTGTYSSPIPSALPGISKVRGAFAKRERKRVIAELLLHNTSGSDQDDHDTIEPVEEPSQTADASVQTEVTLIMDTILPEHMHIQKKRSRGVQVYPEIRHKEVQTFLCETHSRRIQCEEADVRTAIEANAEADPPPQTTAKGRPPKQRETTPAVPCAKRKKQTVQSGKPAYGMCVNDPDWKLNHNLGGHELVDKSKVPLEKIKTGKKVTERAETQLRVSERIKTRQKMFNSKQPKNQQRASKRTKTHGRSSSTKKTELRVAKARKKKRHQEFEIVIENDHCSVLESLASDQNAAGIADIGDVLRDCVFKQEVLGGDCAVKQEVFDGECAVKQEVFDGECAVKQEIIDVECAVKQEVCYGDSEFLPIHFESSAGGVYSQSETLGTQTDLTAERNVCKHSEFDSLLKENTRLMRQPAKKGGMGESMLSDSIDECTNNFDDYKYNCKVKIEPESDW